MSYTIILTFTTHWAHSADDKLVIFFFFLENMIWHFMQIVFIYVVGTHLNCIDKSMQFKWEPTTYIKDNLHEMSKPVFQEK